MVTVACISLLILLFFYCLLALLNKGVGTPTFIVSVIIMVLALAIIGYNTIPYAEDDLTRYYYEVNVFKNMGIEYAILEGTWSDTVLSSLFLFLISRIGVPEIIPAIGIMIIPLVACIFMANNNKAIINSRSLMLILFILGGFCEAYISLSAFRYSYGIAIAAIIIYADARGTLKNKIVKIILYLMLPFIHTSLIVVSIVALLTHLIRKKTIIIIEIITLVFFDGLVTLMSNSGITTLASIGYKITQYDKMYSIGTSTGLTFASFVGIGAILLITRDASAFCRHIELKLNDSQKFLSDYILNLTVFTVIMFPLVSALFFRLNYLIVLLSVPILYNYIAYARTNKKVLLMLLLIFCALIKWYFQYLNYFTIWQF